MSRPSKFSKTKDSVGGHSNYVRKQPMNMSSPNLIHDDPGSDGSNFTVYTQQTYNEAVNVS